MDIERVITSNMLLVEKWKLLLNDRQGIGRGHSYGPSKDLGTIKHQLLIAKLYGFNYRCTRDNP